MRGRRFIALIIVVVAGFAAVVFLQREPAAPSPSSAPSDAAPVSPAGGAGVRGVPLK